MTLLSIILLVVLTIITTLIIAAPYLAQHPSCQAEDTSMKEAESPAPNRHEELAFNLTERLKEEVVFLRDENRHLHNRIEELETKRFTMNNAHSELDK